MFQNWHWLGQFCVDLCQVKGKATRISTHFLEYDCVKASLVLLLFRKASVAKPNGNIWHGKLFCKLLVVTISNVTVFFLQNKDSSSWRFSLRMNFLHDCPIPLSGLAIWQPYLTMSLVHVYSLSTLGNHVHLTESSPFLSLRGGCGSPIGSPSGDEQRGRACNYFT